jgi:3-methyladenine DNA glycosylase AlkD
MEAQALADEIERRLRAVGTEKRAVGEKAYLKSDLEFVGATVWQTRTVMKEMAAELPPPTHDEVIELAAALWEKPIHERRAAAAILLDRHATKLEPGDLPFIERLIRDSCTWALVDELAGDTVSRILVDHPEIEPVLDRWAADPDFWVRRSAMLAHLRRIRAGGELGAFARYADAMLDEREFFIRKAIGWVLREAGKKRPADVAAWLAPRTHRASGVTMREAVKYLPPDDAERLMTAYREHRPAA